MSEIENFITYLEGIRQGEKVIPFLEELVREHEDQPLLVRALAEQLHRAGRSEEAIARLDLLGDALLTSGKTKEAAEVITQILLMNPPNAQDYRLLLTQIQQGQ